MDDREFYTVQEAADEVRCSARTIYRYIEAGVLEARQGPTTRLIPNDSLRKFIASFPPVGAC